MTKDITIHQNIDHISPSQWEELLKSSTANFFQTPEAIRFFKATELDIFTFAIEKNEEIIAVLSGIIQKEKGIKSTFTSRAIVFGGPIFSDNIEEHEILKLLNILIENLKNKVIYIEFRNLNNYQRFSEVFAKAGFKYNRHMNFHLDCTDEQAIKKRMSSSKLRQVKKSIKEGAEIVEATNLQEIEDYYTILLHLYKTKVKTPLPNLDFFTTMWKTQTAKFLLIRFNNEIIGGIVAPILADKVIYEWFVCGKDGVYKNIYPSILATWAAMDYANRNNIARFDFMGAGKPEEDYGVREFKSKFGGESVEHGRFCYVAKPFLYEMGKTAVKILKKHA